MSIRERTGRILLAVWIAGAGLGGLAALWEQLSMRHETADPEWLKMGLVAVAAPGDEWWGVREPWTFGLVNWGVVGIVGAICWRVAVGPRPQPGHGGNIGEGTNSANPRPRGE